MYPSTVVSKKQNVSINSLDFSKVYGNPYIKTNKKRTI